MAWNLASGRLQMYAVTFAFVPHPPLSYFISGIVLQIFGLNITVARTLTAIYGILTTILLFYLGKELLNKKIGLIASFLFAIFPLALVFNRTNLDYNLLQLLSVFTVFSCIKYFKTKNQKWFYAASLSAGAASISNPLGLGLVLGLFVIFSIDRNLKSALKSALVSIIIISAYPLSMLALNSTVFTQTVDYYLFFAATEKFGGGLGYTFLSRTQDIISYTPWITFGLMGLLAYPIFFRKKRETIILFGLFGSLSLFTLALFNADATRGIIQLFPFCALGIAFLTWAIPQTIINSLQAELSKALKSVKLKNLAVICIWLSAISLVSLPLGQAVYSDFNSVFTGFHMPDDLFRTQSPNDAYKVASYLNSHINSNDFVIVSKQIAWLIKCNVTAIDQAAAFNQTNDPEIIRPKGLDNYTPDRFVFNCSYHNAKFLVTDNMVLNWYYPKAFFKNILLDVHTNWVQVYQLGEYTVFLNPRFTHSSNRIEVTSYENITD